MESIEIAGFVLAVAALLISIFGIWDIRGKVRSLIELERDRAVAWAIKDLVEKLVDPVPNTDVLFSSTTLIHIMILENALDQRKGAELEYKTNLLTDEAINSAVKMAGSLINMKIATWKPFMNEEKANKMLREAQNDRNRRTVKSMLR